MGLMQTDDNGKPLVVINGDPVNTNFNISSTPTELNFAQATALKVYNAGPDTIYYGGTASDATTGLPIFAGFSTNFEMGKDSSLQFTCNGSDTAVLRTLQGRLVG